MSHCIVSRLSKFHVQHLAGDEDEDGDDDDDDDEPMLLEPQTEMTVEGEDDDEGDEDDGGSSTGDEIALPPSVTLRPAGAPQQPLLSVRLNPR